MLEGFWESYTAYRDSGSRERIPVSIPGGTIEIYYSMSAVRAVLRPAHQRFPDAAALEGPAEAFAKSHSLLVDFRDGSYVLTDEDGVYYTRLRPGEALFTPERFEERQDLLEALVRLYA